VFVFYSVKNVIIFQAPSAVSCRVFRWLEISAPDTDFQRCGTEIHGCATEMDGCAASNGIRPQYYRRVTCIKDEFAYILDATILGQTTKPDNYAHVTGMSLASSC